MKPIVHPDIIDRYEIEELLRIYRKKDTQGILDLLTISTSNAAFDIAIQVFHWNRKYFNFELIDVTTCSAYIRSYRSGESNDWHIDINEDYNRRKLSAVVPLQLAHEGGDIEFMSYHNLPRESTASVGSLILFPSYEWHRVTKVESGERISLVMFFEGSEPFR